MRKLFFTLIDFIPASPFANVAVKWNDSSSSGNYEPFEFINCIKRHFAKSAAFCCVAALTNVSTSFAEMAHTNVGNYDFREVLGYEKNLALDFELFETFDVDADGNDDLIFGISVRDIETDLHKENERATPVVFFWDKTLQEYAPREEFQKKLPKLYYPRRVKGYSDAKTGKSYLFIADHGLDGTHKPNCGSKNVLLTYDPKTAEIAYSSPSQFDDYSHALASIDINSDGLLDHLVLNSPYIDQSSCENRKSTNESYFLISQPNGEYKQQQVKFKYGSFGTKPYYDAGHAIARNNKIFFVLGRGHNSKVKGGIDVFKLTEGFKLVKTDFISAPKDLQKVSYSDIASSEGLIIANAVDTSRGWKGRYIQLIDISEGKFKWKKENFLQSAPAPQPNEKVDWCLDINFIRHNDALIFVCATRRDVYQGRPMASVLRDGVFAPIEINTNKKPTIGGRHRGLRPVLNQNVIKIVSWDYTGDRTLPTGMVYEKIAINHIDVKEFVD